MDVATTAPSPFQPWSEEPSSRPDRRKTRARIGGLHCSLCTGTIEKALGRMPGVDKVAVSLTQGEIVSRQLVVACGDASEVLEATEGILDEMAQLVGFLVEAERLFSIRSIGDDGLGVRSLSHSRSSALL